MQLGDERLVLASASATRAAMLRAAGVAFEVDPGAVDEAEVKAAMRADGASPGDVAEALAELKARGVSARHPDALVIGADQMLACGGAWFDKPADRDAARKQLQRLSGAQHELVSAAVIVRDGTRIWHATRRARLSMRVLSDGFLDAYLDACGNDVTGSVGAYRLEALGAQLFVEIEGDHFTVLGLPLLPLLAFLRERAVLMT